MPDTERADAEHVGFERTIANLLRAGVSISAAVVLSGGLCYVIRSGHESAGYHAFHRTSTVYTNVFRTFAAAAAGDCRAIIQLGLLFLIATPVARVAFSAVAFARERDLTYVAATLIVLAILLVSLLR